MVAAAAFIRCTCIVLLTLALSAEAAKLAGRAHTRVRARAQVPSKHAAAETEGGLNPDANKIMDEIAAKVASELGHSLLKEVGDLGAPR